ncbi:hypothetical protein [Streptomyces beigongshangae]|uniref:hypothetical protein n=1 Tax=Streptomyces beigongshangae TaxID=2841597 RepID=UPI001C8433AF|nr:hypothetical protein [Streptomyces sp. REN17]
MSLRNPAVRAELILTACEGGSAARARALDMPSPEHTGPLLDPLLAGLADPSPVVRDAGAGRLLSWEPPSVRDVLVAALRAERDPEVAGTLLSGFGWRGEHRVADLAVRWPRDPVAGRRTARCPRSATRSATGSPRSPPTSLPPCAAPPPNFSTRWPRAVRNDAGPDRSPG